ncbi:putative trehalose-phosphate phosphatase 3 [Dichanthelium oligosanthes]|uniref:Trehalose 6-phosphate phosphatase n=1 Tax=Dichanthelium oligosanthes TaxID=888268 RepID=A0A1E5WGL7_9POAL|nr:putative trehalose-phosphate phosphatase 3 [Dichanthelium oligosanthes]
MTKHAGFPTDEAVTTVAAPAPAGLHFTPFPLPKVATRDCKKLAAVQVDIAAPAVAVGGSWFESMKASSPRRSADAEHGDWMEKHPSALTWFEAALGGAEGKQIVMFLDYDGTLSPIVEDPDRAVMSEEMRDAVRRVAELFPTAIVSGRCRDKVFNFVKLTELYYAGSHGMDIEGPANQSNKHVQANGGEAVHYQAGSEFLPVIEEMYRTLTAKMESITGAMVEHNKYCLSVHFRCVQEEEWNAVEEEVRSVLKDYPNLKLTHGRKVLEIRPSIKWDKGKALEFLLKSLGYAGRSDVFPIYVGDDRTDEDAFKVLRGMGQGIGILVSKFPKETAASYSLRDPAEVMEFLRKMVNPKGDGPEKMMT